VTFGEALAETSRALAGAGIADAPREALLLLELATGRNREEWYRDRPRLTPAAVSRLRSLTARRRRREPFAYLRGWQEFCGLRLAVSRACLVPRPETETLVQAALTMVPRRPGAVVDVGTGSGAVALAMAAAGDPAWEVLGVDVSPAALAVAQANARALGLAERVAFRASSLLEDVGGPLVAVVANLPYVGADDAVDPEVWWEPPDALFAGRDGLGLMAALMPQAAARLEPGGLLLLEVGASQAKAVARLMEAAGFTDVGTACDLAGVPRVVWGWCDGHGGGPDDFRGRLAGAPGGRAADDPD
jgi:release factor glutamine methyltransferase